MNHHVNHVILVGRILQTWTYENDRGVRLLMRRATFLPLRSDGPSDLVNVILPEAAARGQVVKENDELHITGFIRNADREVTLASIVKGIELPSEVKKARIRQIVTEVVAVDWQIITEVIPYDWQLAPKSNSK
jgi:hypothetical protein